MKSLKFQLLSRSLLILAVLLVLIGSLQYLFMRDIVYKNRAVSMQSHIMSIPPPFWQDFSKMGVNDLRPPFLLMPGVSVAVIDELGNYSVLTKDFEGIAPPRLKVEEYLAVLAKRRERSPEELKSVVRPGFRQELNYKVVDEGGTQQVVVLQPIFFHHGQVEGVIQMSSEVGPLKALLIRQLMVFGLVSLVALLFGIFVFLPVLKRTLVPLSNMVEMVEQIDAGNLAQRLPTEQGQSEIDRLAETFNRMLERLEASFIVEKETKEQMGRFVADASHELRTPLTSISGFLDVLLRGAAYQPAQLRKALKSMQKESERLKKIVYGLLLLTNLERKPHIELREGFLDTLINDMDQQLRILAGRRRFSLQVEPNIKCKHDEDKIKQVILNLFQNAVQHTDPEKGQIQVSLLAKNQGAELAVQDNGPGISEIHLPHIFDRFYRSDPSRTRKYGGSGLGLSIAKSLVDAHNGTIKVVSKEGHGSTFFVWLPA